MNSFLKIALIAIVCGGAPAFGQAWSDVISCEGGHMALDQSANEYQLVLRQVPGVLNYFSKFTDVSAAVNAKGELIVPMFQSSDETRGQAGDFSGPLNGDIFVSLTALSPDTEKVRLIKVSYRGTAVTELANWIFHDCQSK